MPDVFSLQNKELCSLQTDVKLDYNGFGKRDFYFLSLPSLFTSPVCFPRAQLSNHNFLPHAKILRGILKSKLCCKITHCFKLLLA